MDEHYFSVRQTVFNFIVKFKMEHDGNSPTYREIMRATGIASTSTVAYHLEKLEEAQLIIRPIHGGNSRVIEVPGAVWIPPTMERIGA